MTDTYAVMGNPISHSKSPMIHQQFAKLTHQSIRYLKIEVPLDQLQSAIAQFRANHGIGLNITAPFKQQAYRLVTDLTERAALVKAVNTIIFLPDDRLLGDNTDGIGFIRDIVVNQHFSLKNKAILLLGAGGAARSILFSILSQAPKELVLANRTVTTAEELSKEFQDFGKIQVSDLVSLNHHFDLIVNAISFAEDDLITLPPTIICKETFCYDLMYGQNPTPFIKWAISMGASRTADGIGMLVEQAAESFYVWRGIKPDTKKVLEMIKAA